MIFITNDDGIAANGIKALTEVARKYDDVIVFAPDGPRSGMSSAISCDKPLTFKHLAKLGNVDYYSCNGTPVDCVKLARQTVINGMDNVLVLSGINHGSNAAVNVIYSGTMGAAMEANICGLPSIGFSITSSDHDADLSAAQDVVSMVLDEYYRGVYDDCYKDAAADVPVCLNVNIPEGEVNGIMVCVQARARWSEDFELRKNDCGEDEYWLLGEFTDLDKGRTDTDLYALSQGMASIVPITTDMTLRHCIERQKK